MFSYGSDISVPLGDEPVTQLLGLNGHGKSSIPLVIEEVLYNKNSKGIKKSGILNRNINGNKYNASLLFSVNNSDYEVKIARTGATQKVYLSKDGTDISSHTATDTFKQIEELLGLDFKTFSQIVYQNNNSSLQFLTATDTNRKKFLIDLLSLERYTKIFDRVKDVHKSVAEDLIKLQSSVNTLIEWLSKTENETLELKDLKIEPEVNEQGKERLSKLKADLQNIVLINKKISQNEQYKYLREAIDYSSLTEHLEKIDASEALQAIGAEKKRLSVIEDLSKKLKNLTHAECPTCLQPIDKNAVSKVLESNTVESKDIKSKITALEESIAEININNKKYLEHQQLVADFEKYSALIDETIPSTILDKSALQEEITCIETAIAAAIAKLNEVKKYNNGVIEHNARVKLLLSQLEEKQLSLKSDKVKLSVIEDKLSILEVLKKAFSTNGLLAYKIENSVKDLQHLTNYYLTELSDGRFQLNFTINNDKLNVVIVDNGIEVDIVALSAGELARVTTSTLLAIRKLMSSLSKSKLNVLFLDETIDVLDTYGKEKLIEVLLKEEDLNTFLISHGYSHPLIKKLTAIKEDGISRIEEN